jgi:hypothetical protein
MIAGEIETSGHMIKCRAIQLFIKQLVDSSTKDS